MRGVVYGIFFFCVFKLGLNNEFIFYICVIVWLYYKVQNFVNFFLEYNIYGYIYIEFYIFSKNYNIKRIYKKG